MRTNTKHILVLFTCLSSSTLPLGCGDDGEDPSSSGSGTTGGGQTESGPTTDDSGPTTDEPTTGTTASTTEPTTGEPTTTEASTGGADTTTGGAETGTTGAAGLEIVGSYIEEFPGGSGTHEITETAWTQDFGMGFVVNLDLLQYDNEADWVVAEDADNPGTFSKLQWTYAGEDLYYCSVVFDAMSEQEALDAPLADDSDPANGGCGDFPWSLLMPN